MPQINPKIIAVVLFVLIPIGISTIFYRGPGQEWMLSYAGDILYTMFFFFLLILIWPKWHPLISAGIAFCFSTAIEFTQLISTPFLESIRSYFLGRTLIGTGFSPVDILYYFLGSILGLLLLRFLSGFATKKVWYN